jgi:hypothetical protein
VPRSERARVLEALDTLVKILDQNR